MQKNPTQMTRLAHSAPTDHNLWSSDKIRLIPFSSLTLLQLSWNHMKPYACIVINVPRNAPIKDTRALNTGMALAMIYAIRTTPPVQLSHVIQWVQVFEAKCLVPRSRRTKEFFAGT